MTSNSNLPIGGFIKQSLIDYPGNISSVIFTQRCNFRCIYCHNPELVWPEKIKKSKRLNSKNILSWINQNRRLLDAVVITGGEPTVHLPLFEFIGYIKENGLKVKLDTNGTNPRILEKLISNNLLDYIAMDVKAPLNLAEYKKLTGPDFNLKQLNSIKTTIELIKNSPVEFEFRTTMVNKYHTEKSIKSIIKYLDSKLYLQNYKSFSDKTNSQLEPNNNLYKFISTSKFGSYVKFRE